VSKPKTASKKTSKKAKFNKPDTPLSESAIPKLKEGSADDVIADLRQMAEEDPTRVISRNYYRINGKYAESVWNQYYGTFHEFKRQAGIVLTRQQHALEKAVAKHASVDHYRKMSEERTAFAESYLRPSNRRFQTMVICSDLHDHEIDPFFLRVLLDTVKRVQPEKVCFNGDVFDLPEFGKYPVDPREWDAAGRIKFVHEKIIGPVRQAAPEAEIDLIEGNHEARLLRQLADATPALRAVLSDIHGMSIADLLGLKKYEVNYIASSDLATFTKRDHDKELQKNYKVYWKCFLAHHFPHGKDMGLPGANGHHHKHIVFPNYSPVYGAYEWHQLGCGHRRSASYCDGAKWHMGFSLVHVDTHRFRVNQEYIPITDFAVVGGKFYSRDEVETLDREAQFITTM
jgi:hypothetical protein